MKKLKFGRLPLAAAIMSSLASTSALAYQLEFDNDSEFSGSVKSTVSYGASFRTRDAQGLYDANGDINYANGGGNNASELRVPNAGDLVSNVFATKLEFNLDWRNFGLVTAAAYQYDSEIMNGKAIDPYTGEEVEWSDAAKDYSGNNLRLLDAYVYGSFYLGDSPLDVRLGQQAINWGEGLIFLDGVSVQSPLDFNKLYTPGAEFKEAMIGNKSLYAQMGIGDNSSIEAYVHFDWNRTEFGPAGTFYGSDAFFRGGEEAWIPSLGGLAMRDPDMEARDDGQWGISGRTTLGDVEVGLYYSRYHETTPVLALTGGNSAFGMAQTWIEDQDMFGASFSTVLGNWSFAGEVAYRPDRAMFTNYVFNMDPNSEDFLLNVNRNDTVNASINGIWLGGPTVAGIDSQYALYQLGVDHIAGDRSTLTPFGWITRNGDQNKNPDAFSYGAAFNWGGTWNGVYPGTNMTLDVFVQHDFQGNSHYWGNFAEGRSMAATSLIFDIGTATQVKGTYSHTEMQNSDFSDQNLISLSVNYKL